MTASQSPVSTRGRKKLSLSTKIKKALLRKNSFQFITNKFAKEYHNKKSFSTFLDCTAIKMLLTQGKKQNDILQFMRDNSQHTWSRKTLRRVIEIVTTNPNHNSKTFFKENNFVKDIIDLKNASPMVKSKMFDDFKARWFKWLRWSIYRKVAKACANRDLFEQYLSYEILLFINDEKLILDIENPKMTFKYVTNLLNFRVNEDTFRDYLGNGHMLKGLTDAHKKLKYHTTKWFNKKGRQVDFDNPFDEKELADELGKSVEHVRDIVHFAEQTNHRYISMDATMSEENDMTLHDIMEDKSAEEGFDEAICSHDVGNLIKKLPEQYRLIVLLHFGFNGERYDVDRLAVKFSMSISSIRNILEKALDIMKNGEIIEEFVEPVVENKAPTIEEIMKNNVVHEELELILS